MFTFGSVPLKTYLPDGDIDLSAFSKDGDLTDTWANHVRDMLKGEEENENAEFRVKEVQYIQAEVHPFLNPHVLLFCTSLFVSCLLSNIFFAELRLLICLFYMTLIMISLVHS